MHLVLRMNKYPCWYFRSYLSVVANVSDALHWPTAESWISILHWLRVVLWFVNLAPFIVSIQWGLVREVGEMLWCLYLSHHSPYSHKPLLSNKLYFRNCFTWDATRPHGQNSKLLGFGFLPPYAFIKGTCVMCTYFFFPSTWCAVVFQCLCILQIIIQACLSNWLKSFQSFHFVL